ncbi:MAG: thiamine phosphate synthase [Arcobacteraceae bacterium]
MKGLYVITPELTKPDNQTMDMLESALKGGARILQLRNKKSDDYELFDLASSIKELCKKYDSLFIIDDRVALAKKVQSDGVHIGKFDMKLKDIREDLKDFIIGVSCYGNVNYAKNMEAQGADYVAFGSFFHSPTKPESNIVPLDTIAKAKEIITVPICAIGGITLDNAPLLVNQGVDMVSVISDIWQNQDIITRAKNYTKLFGDNI